MKIIIPAIVLIFYSAAIGITLAAIYTLETLLQVKVLLAMGFILFIAALVILTLFLNSQSQQYYVTRALFIALENLRRDQNTDKPALELLQEDLEEEATNQRISESLIGTKLTNGVIILIFVFICYISFNVFSAFVF